MGISSSSSDSGAESIIHMTICSLQTATESSASPSMSPFSSSYTHADTHADLTDSSPFHKGIYVTLLRLYPLLTHVDAADTDEGKSETKTHDGKMENESERAGGRGRVDVVCMEWAGNDRNVVKQRERKWHNSHCQREEE